MRLNPWVLAGLTLLLLAAMAGSCLLGAVDFERGEIFHSPIFWRLRLPRVLMSVLVGAVLSVCGAAYQSIFRNPLTDPYVLGVSSGASLGAAVAILLGMEAVLWGVGGMALAAALLTVLFIYRIASIGNRMHTTTLMVAFAVSSCGVIGFVGLIVPHAVRLVAGPDNRRVVPYSMLVGALFVLVCDTLARYVLRPSELPVGSLTSMVGAPLFIYLLYKNKKGI